jgi:prepilin-type N-terminal cleavage/methylation domain-containing protein
MLFTRKFGSKKGFTLIELLVVIAIVAILATVVVLTLNPVELLRQSRDGTRLASTNALNSAIGLFVADQNSSIGSVNTVYVSIADSSSSCLNLGLSILPSGWTYRCVASSTLTKTDGTGWIPIDLRTASFGSSLGTLPIDPVNATSSGLYYTYTTDGSSAYQINAGLESRKYLTNGAIANFTDPASYVTGNNLSLAPFSRGLVGFWNFEDNNNATTTDLSGWGNTGTWNGSSTLRYDPGRIGLYSGQFNGTNDYLDLGGGKAINTTSTISISAWIKTLSPSQTRQVVLASANSSAATNYGFLMFAAKKVGMWNTGGGADAETGQVINDSNWHHVATVRSGGLGNWTVKVYVDGSLLVSATTANNPLNGISPSAAMGRFGGYTGGGYTFNGDIDNVRVYNRALSDLEIAGLAAGTY